MLEMSQKLVYTFPPYKFETISNHLSVFKHCKSNECKQTLESQTKPFKHCANFWYYIVEGNILFLFRAGGQLQSRLCKAVLFQSFKDIAAKFGVEHLSNLTYGEAKREAKEFQVAKEVLFNRFQQLGRGTWIRKPEEEEEFM